MREGNKCVISINNSLINVLMPSCRRLPLLRLGLLLGASQLIFSCNPVFAAMGFTGNFAPKFWTLTQDQGKIIDPECGTDPLGGPSCIDTAISPAELSVYGGPLSGSISESIWSWDRLADTSAYTVSFNVTCVVCGLGDNDPKAYYRIGNQNSLWVQFTGTADVAPTFMSSTSTVAFRISVPTAAGDGAAITIRNFDAVPGPLPAAGAATAFGYSRRLRRRIKGEAPARSGKSSRSSDPSSYLLLSPASQQVLPLSFSYSPQQHKGFSFAASFSIPAPTAGDSVSVHSGADGDIL